MSNPKGLKKMFALWAEGHEARKQEGKASKLRRAEKETRKSSRRRVRRQDWADLMDGDDSAFDEVPIGIASTKEIARQMEREEGEAARKGELAPGLSEGLAVFVGRGVCRVEGIEGEGGEVECDLTEDLRARQRTALAVGDRVGYDPGRLRVEQVLPRESRLSRPDPANPALERVIVANVDVVVIVAAVREPRLSVGLIERMVVAVEHGGAEPLVCVSKLDLCEDPETELAPLAPLAAAGLRVVGCSASTGEGVADLADLLAGRTCVFVGHSGVGKSSLLNALDPELGIAVNAVRASDGKGRHTTSASTLHRLACGARVIDTPGVREFGLWNLSAGELAGYFPELAEHAGACRFRDCSHLHEPDCAVRAAVASGAIPEARWSSYLRIRATLKR